MSDPFAWMAGQIATAVAAQEPSGSVALSPAMRRVLNTAKALRRPIASTDIAQREQITLQHASSLIRRAHHAGILRPAGEQKNGSAIRAMYELDPRWK